MEKLNYKKVSNVMIHAYFASSVILILVLLFGTLDPWLFSILGSTSIHISMAQVIFPDGDTILMIAVLWLLTFPVALLVGYVLFLVKKWRIPFLVLMISDCVAVTAYFIGYWLIFNSYDGTFVLIDVLISSAYIAVLLFMMRNQGKQIKPNDHGAPSAADCEP